MSDITDQFNKFAGREVCAVATPNDRMSYSPYKVKLEADNPAVEELRKAAADAGLKLRLMFPEVRYINNREDDRLSVHLSKVAEGKYVISSFGLY